MTTKVIFSWFLFLIGQTVFSQEIIVDSIYFEETKSYRTFKVWLPFDYDPSNVYQTIYCFDGDFLFNIIAANTEIYADADVGVIPPAIVVGIFFDNRNEDMGIVWSDGTLNEKGGAFKKMVQEELILKVEQNYTVSDYRSIIGHSNSTSFAQTFLWDDQPTFQGYLTLSQYELPSDKRNYSGLIVKQNKPIDFVCVSSELDAQYRVESGENLKKLLDSLKIMNFNTSHISLPNANHLTMVPQGIPLGLQQLYNDYSTAINVDEIRASGCLQNQSPINAVDSIIDLKADKYGVVQNGTYSGEYFDILFMLYVHEKDSIGLNEVTQRYAEVAGDSTEYFFAAQCLEMMGAFYSAESAYLKHHTISSYKGYWSYARLVNLYCFQLNKPQKAIYWAVNGLKDLEEERIIKNLVRIGSEYPKFMSEIILELQECAQSVESLNLKKEIYRELINLTETEVDQERNAEYQILLEELKH